MSGNCIKFLVIVEELRRHPGQHILITDVDLVVTNPADLRAYLEPYKRYEITYMAESPGSKDSNIGFAMIQSTPATIAFYTQILEELQRNSEVHDQAHVIERLSSFPGSTACFEGSVIKNSNYHKVGEPYYIVQCLCSNDSYEKNMWEKLLTLATFFDLEPLRPFISDDVWETVLWYHREKRPDHPLAHVKFAPLPQ